MTDEIPELPRQKPVINTFLLDYLADLLKKEWSGDVIFNRHERSLAISKMLNIQMTDTREEVLAKVVSAMFAETSNDHPEKGKFLRGFLKWLQQGG